MEQGILISLVQSRHSINNMPFFVKNGDGDCGETQRLISPWDVRIYGQGIEDWAVREFIRKFHVLRVTCSSENSGSFIISWTRRLRAEFKDK